MVFANAGHRVSSATVNRTRLFIALIVLILVHLIFFGSVFPMNLNREDYIYLALSGIAGYVIGDSFLFESLVMIGPRLAMLIMTGVPVVSTIFAWIFLGEHLKIIEIIAMCITLSGMAWVVLEKDTNPKATIKNHYFLGVLFAAIGSIGQASGLLFSKIGLKGGVNVLSANLIRILTASFFFLIFSIAAKTMLSDIRKLRKSKKAVFEISSGTLIGPVLGVILSLEAIRYTHIGIASTLMSLSPAILIPVSHFLYHEKITLRAIIGTLIVIGGASWLFFA